MCQLTILSVLSLLICTIIFQATAMLNVASGVPCGKTFLRRGKVKNGNDAKEGEFPWLVSIRFGKGVDAHHICGGSLIHNQFVLTAAHCVHRLHTKHAKIIDGEHNVGSQSSYEAVHSIKKVHLHKDYKGYINDIALIELETPVKWSKYVSPICLPDVLVDAGSDSLDSQQVTVAGWGLTDELSKGGTEPAILKTAKLSIVDLQTCQKWYDAETKIQPPNPQYVKIYSEKHLCAGYESGEKDACEKIEYVCRCKNERTGIFVNQLKKHFITLSFTTSMVEYFFFQHEQIDSFRADLFLSLGITFELAL